MTEPKTRAIIGCDTTWDYSQLMPIACLLWRDLVGYTPRVMLIGDEAAWAIDSCTRAALAALRHHAIEHVFVRPTAGYKTSAVAMTARTHAACDPTLPDEDWLLIADADLWPTHRDVYRQHEGRAERVVAYFYDANCFQNKEQVVRGWDDQVPFQPVSSNYFTMKVGAFRELYQYASPDVSEGVRATLDTYLRPRMERIPEKASDEQWHFDEYRMSELLCRQEWFERDVVLLPRRGEHRRGHLAPWDMGGDWEGGMRVGEWVDVHIRKGVYAHRRWEKLLPVIDHLLPMHTAWIREYFDHSTEDAP